MTTRPIGIYRRRAYAFIRDASGVTAYPVQYGSWDVACRLCLWSGSDPYPVGRDTAFRMAAEHLQEAHRE